MKILYNITIKIESSSHDEWFKWMKDVHIPEVMATECFETFRMTKILGDDDEHGIGYAIQYIAPDQETFSIYQTKYAKKLQEEHASKYHNKYVAFRTLMEVVLEG